VIESSGAQAEVERRISALTEQSLAALDAAPMAEPAREALRRLADAATQRTV
jgi:geranylgeranyl diphosphate synthase type I